MLLFNKSCVFSRNQLAIIDVVMMMTKIFTVQYIATEK